MEMANLKTAISYESKLVKRSWLFYLFIFGILAYTLGVILWDYYGLDKYINWEKFVFASSFPLYGIYFLNLFQSVFVTFITCDIQRKRKKAETREVLSVRPIGNGQSFLGEFLGILIPFLTIDIIFIIILMIINTLIPDSPVNLWVNLFYLLTHVLPTLVFIIGLSLLVNRLVKHLFISWIILVAFLYFAYTYLTTPLHGILDFQGSSLPNSFSSMVGFMHLSDYLLHRGVFLLLGISFLYFAALFTKRQPGIPGRKHCFIIPASLFLVFALVLGVTYVAKFQTRLKNRIGYRETFVKYDEHPKARVLEHDITYQPEGNKFSATSRMRIQNQKKVKMEQLLLFLNPGLKIDKIESGGQNLPFHRDQQVIVIERPLTPGENIELKIEYKGTIDEDIYQVNIPDDTFFSPRTKSDGENYGNRTAFVSGKYTLLLPQLMWYPIAVPPVELQASKETNFTDYTLHVKNPGEMTVLSQGEPTREGDNVTFHNVQNLTGLTLCIGNYEKRAVTVDSLTVEFYTYPGNSFYMKYFDEWEPLKKDNPNREKNLTEIFNRCKDEIEYRTPNPYPFKYFKLIEVPSSSYFRATTSFSDNIQPEIALFWERLCRVQSGHPGTISADPNQDESVEEFILYRKIPAFFSMIRVSNIFSNYNNSIMSDTYQGIELIFKQIMNLKDPGYEMSPKILNHFAEKGLNGIIAEGYSREQSSIIFYKVSHLLGYLSTITTWDSLSRFTREFNERAHFQEINFDSFIEDFEQRFGQDIKAYMDEWYTTRQIPTLVIKDISRKTTEETQIIDFEVGNFSETDGIVSILASDDYGSITGYCRSYLIEPGECKRIVIHENIEHHLKLTTNFSGNLPKDISFDNSESPLSGPAPKEGVTPIERTQFYSPREIIVDNEKGNFQLIDSANNRKRLADLIKKEDDREYVESHAFKANTWNPFLSQELYGNHIRSAFVKEAGTGMLKAEWTADLPEAGKYEIFIYRPHLVIYGAKQFTTDYPGMKNYYTVYTPEGKKEIILEVPEGDSWTFSSSFLPEEETWVSLGTFTLPAGESRVVQDDRGVAPIPVEKFRSTFVQLVVADAVKWVKEK
ncbi:hypothetical protein [uncultured Sanguibacteroides sp.]|uniref:hypothetical protein n=1 Tax=uncultured Sanguibacteroides sp. TaxID=1635151 RepID=UPI0025FA47FB|nr:hypothetical protein [uncultured Sanguibacteroides sp.]